MYMFLYAMPRSRMYFAIHDSDDWWIRCVIHMNVTTGAHRCVKLGSCPPAAAR